MGLTTELMQASNLPLGQQIALLKTDGTSLLLQVIFGAQGGVAPQTAALTGTILIDPQNVSGQASDSNPPTITNSGVTGPCFRTWAGLVAAWGTYAPVLNVTTTIVFISSHPDNTDPVIFTPFVGRGAVVSIQGATPTVLAAGVVLAGTTAKNRAAGTNSLLITTLGASGAVGVLVENTTHSSRAWAYKALGGNSFSMTQPLVKAAVPGTSTPAEVDTWANGDSVNLLAVIQVNIALFAPVIIDGTGNSKCYLFQLQVLDPAGVAANLCYLGDVRVYECSIQRYINMVSDAGVVRSLVMTNVFNQGGIEAIGAGVSVFGGAVTATAANFILGGSLASAVSIDGDFIVGAQLFLGGGAQIGFLFLDANISVQAGIVTHATIAYGGHVLYGSGANVVGMFGTSHFFLNGGTFAAAFTAPGLVTGIQLNGAATASSHTGASPDVLNSAITTTPAHLDAAAGAAGFGGNAFNLGGASVSNFN